MKTTVEEARDRTKQYAERIVKRLAVISNGGLAVDDETVAWVERQLLLYLRSIPRRHDEPDPYPEFDR